MGNKTHIASGFPTPPEPQTSHNEGGFYAPSPGIRDNRTYIPGMKRSDNPTSPNTERQQVDNVPLRIEFQNRPVAGILYSVSRDSRGEVFPVYVGRNIIGSHHECDVYLTEETVSSKHAVLLIRLLKGKDGEKITTMSLSDAEAVHGTSINGEQIIDDVCPIDAGDILGFGKAYRFVFIPLDAEKFGLTTDLSFVSIPRKENNPVVNNDFMKYMLPFVDNTVYPDAVGEQDEFTFYGRTKKAKEDHSNKKTL